MLESRSCNSTRYAVCTTSAAGQRSRIVQGGSKFYITVSLFSRRKRFAEIHEMYDNDTIYTMPRHKRYVEEPKFDVFLNPSKKDKQEETLKNLTKRFQRVFRSMDMKNSYPALFQVQ